MAERETLFAGFAEQCPLGPLSYFGPYFEVDAWNPMTAADHMEAAPLLDLGWLRDDPCGRERWEARSWVLFYLGC